jgi:uncharacterized oligopeptide transporter (OPT) family protein
MPETSTHGPYGTITTGDQARAKRGLSPRAVLAGLAIGVLLNLSNTYYGLRIGAGSQLSMVSSLVGFASFKLASRFTTAPFSAAENVLLVSVASATEGMSVTAGFGGAIPALEYLIAAGECDQDADNSGRRGSM